MSEAAVIGLGIGIGMVGGMGYLAIKLPSLPVEPPLAPEVKAPVRRAAIIAAIGGLILAVGSVAASPIVAASGALIGLAGFVAVPVAGLAWRRKAERAS